MWMSLYHIISGVGSPTPLWLIHGTVVAHLDEDIWWNHTRCRCLVLFGVIAPDLSAVLWVQKGKKHSLSAVLCLTEISQHIYQRNVVWLNVKALKKCATLTSLINGCLLYSLFTMNVSMACHTYFLVWFLLV